MTNSLSTDLYSRNLENLLLTYKCLIRSESMYACLIFVLANYICRLFIADRKGWFRSVFEQFAESWIPLSTLTRLQPFRLNQLYTNPTPLVTFYGNVGKYISTNEIILVEETSLEGQNFQYNFTMAPETAIKYLTSLLPCSSISQDCEGWCNHLDKIFITFLYYDYILI